AAAEHRARSGVLADQAQPAAAAGEELLGDLFEVLRRRLERLLEGLADAAVGVADQALELAHRGLEVLALGLELLDVLERLFVLLLGERVDGAELLAPPVQALDAAFEVGPGGGVQGLVGRLGLEAELGGEAAEVAVGVLGAVAGL